MHKKLIDLDVLLLHEKWKKYHYPHYVGSEDEIRYKEQRFQRQTDAECLSSYVFASDTIDLFFRDAVYQ